MRLLQVLAVLGLGAALRAGEVADVPPNSSGASKPAVGLVCHVKVLTDKTEDVSSLAAWKKTYIKDGMSDQDKAIAIWKSVATFQNQDAPPNEMLYAEELVYDPIKMFNVYGYAMCCNASAHVESLSRYVGLKARGWGINCHSVPEIYFDNAWHLFDSSLINYFPKADGKVASVDEIIAGVKDWYAKNPGFKDEKGKPIGDKLFKFMRETPEGYKGGPKGWSRGPDVLLRSPTMTENGWHAAKTHGWYSTMQEYDGSCAFLYEYAATPGYELNIQIRPGEKITRNWSNKGLHVNMDGAGNAPGSLTAKPEDSPHWALFGNHAPGRVGNGTHEYDVPLATGLFKSTALACDNLATSSDDKAAPALHVKDGAKPAELVLHMPSSYVNLSGTASLKAVVGQGGEIVVALSDNNGLDFKEVSKITQTGEQTLDLKKFVFRRYDYRLKFSFKGTGTGLDALKLTHDIQHSQRPLPALLEGENKISVDLGAPTATVTVDGNFGEHGDKQRSFKELHPKFEACEVGKPTGAEGSVTFPVRAPGEIIAVRMSAAIRNWDDQSNWDLQVSFDEAKTWKTIGTVAPQAAGCEAYAECREIPANTKKVLARYLGHKKGDTQLMAFRVDADYKEAAAGVAPIKVTYVWSESGADKTDSHTAAKAGDTYTIKCGPAPLMKSIVLEWGQ